MYKIMIENIKEILPYLGTLAIAITAWYKDYILIRLGIKKNKVELEASDIENVKANLSIYKDLIDDIDSRYKQRLDDIEISFSNTIAKLKGDIESLQRLNDDLSKIITKQRAKIKYYQDKYGLD